MTSEKAPTKSLGNVLVVGGCGFLGHHIVRQLSETYSCNLSVLDLKTTKNRFPNVAYHDVDITSPEAVNSAFKSLKPQVIIHTASPATVTEGSSNREKGNAGKIFYKVNVEGTRNLLEQATQVGGVKAFVYTSSASIIHDNSSDLINADERWPRLFAPTQKEYYSETKALAEESVLAANRKDGSKMLTCALRPALLYGEGDMQYTPNLMTAYAKGQTKFQLGENDNLWNFTYAGNAAHAHILAAIALLQTHSLNVEPLDNERVDGEAFIITDGEPLYFWDFVRRVWRAAGDKTELRQVWTLDRSTGLFIATIIEWLFWFAGGRVPNLTRQKVNYSCMARYFNIDKARERLGYKAQIDMEEAINRSVRWFQERQKAEAGKKDQ